MQIKRQINISQYLAEFRLDDGTGENLSLFGDKKCETKIEYVNIPRGKDRHRPSTRFPTGPVSSHSCPGFSLTL